jgi:hypothetical protein
LTLLVTRICADHTNNAFTANDFAVAANFFHRSRNSHGFLLKLIVTQTLSDQVKFVALHKWQGFFTETNPLSTPLFKFCESVFCQQPSASIFTWTR